MFPGRSHRSLVVQFHAAHANKAAWRPFLLLEIYMIITAQIIKILVYACVIDDARLPGPRLNCFSLLVAKDAVCVHCTSVSVDN